MRESKNYKLIWVYYKMREKFDLTLNQLKKIAQALGYKEGWADVQYKEIRQEKKNK